MCVNALLRTSFLSFLLYCTRISEATADDHRKFSTLALDSRRGDASTENDLFRFVTRPDIQAPRWNITIHDEGAVAPGYWFVAPYEVLAQKQRGAAWVGPHIYDGQGELIWSGTSLFDSFNIFDFRPMEINGEMMFTATYKREDAGLIIDSSYQIRKMVHWPGGHNAANMHEFTLFDGGNKALVLTRESHQLGKAQSQALGHEANCHVNTNGLLELDITTSPPSTLFNFSLIEHISVDEITYPSERNVSELCRDGWDANHCNSVDRFENGDYLVSCRHTDALYKISRESGKIVWRLGTTRSDFEFDKNARFSRQHHARVLNHNETHTIISLFDNARGESLDAATYEHSRGLILSLHEGRADVMAEYARPDHKYSTSRGSLEVLPNGNVFMGWTFDSRISEHSADGRLLMEARLPPKKNSYRSYKSPWVGRPSDPPDAWSRAVDAAGPLQRLSTEIYVSWNGATEVAQWNVYRSNAQGLKVDLIKSAAKTGFETSVKING